MHRRRHSHGISIVEIVVSAAIIAIVVTGVAGAWQLYIKVSNAGSQYATAALLIEETSEALTLLRDASWTNNVANLSLNTPYYLYWNGSAYNATTTVQVSQGAFIRTFILSSIKRDANDDISSSGTVDVGTRDVVVTVTPSNNASSTIAQAEFLLHNVYNN